MRKVLLIGALASAMVLTNCDLWNSIFDTGSPYAMMKDTTPVVQTGAAKALETSSRAISADPRAIAQDDPNYSLYSIFQDYVYPRDEGKIDTGNLYKLLYESSQILTSRKLQATQMAAKAIPSPFDFGNAPKTYDHAFNSLREQGGNYDYTLAYLISGAHTVACYGYTVREAYDGGTKTQRQIFETEFDDGSGDIVLDFCTFDDKPDGTAEDFGRRAFVSGNQNDHSFFIQFTTGSSTMSASIVGKGVSQGSGYFVLCRISGPTPFYFKLPAGATEGNFEAAVGVPDIAALDDPEGYAAAIQAYLATPEFAARKNIPTSLDSFTNNGLLAL